MFRRMITPLCRRWGGGGEFIPLLFDGYDYQRETLSIVCYGQTRTNMFVASY